MPISIDGSGTISGLTAGGLPDLSVNDADIVSIASSKLTGTVPTAILGSGTANSTSFLRGDQTWQTINLTVSSTDVLNAIAGASAGDIGTYIFAQTSGVDVSRNGTIAGSSLQSTSALSRNLQETNTSGATFSNSEGSLSGTWRCMGTYDYDFNRTSGPVGGGATLWLRIS